MVDAAKAEQKIIAAKGGQGDLQYATELAASACDSDVSDEDKIARLSQAVRLLAVHLMPTPGGAPLFGKIARM